LAADMTATVEKGWSWKVEHETYQRLFDLATVLRTVPREKTRRLESQFADLVEGEILQGGSSAPLSLTLMMWGAVLDQRRIDAWGRLHFILLTYLGIRSGSQAGGKASDFARVLSERLSRPDAEGVDPRVTFFVLDGLRTLAARKEGSVDQELWVRAERALYRRALIQSDSDSGARSLASGAASYAWADLSVLAGVESCKDHLDSK
jgi:hypothetical protein